MHVHDVHSSYTPFCSLVSVIGLCLTCGSLLSCKYNNMFFIMVINWLQYFQCDLSTGRCSYVDLVDCG